MTLTSQQKDPSDCFPLKKKKIKFATQKKVD